MKILVINIDLVVNKSSLSFTSSMLCYFSTNLRPVKLLLILNKKLIF